jgi:cell division septum initiation protein DivIVA
MRGIREGEGVVNGGSETTPRFPIVRKGLDQREVYPYLERLKLRIEELERDNQRLQGELEELRRQVENPELDIDRVTEIFGKQASEILRSAHDISSSIRKRAELNAKDIISKAERQATDLELQASVAAEAQMTEAAERAREIVDRAKAEATEIIALAEQGAQSISERAKAEGRSLLHRARELRSKVFNEMQSRIELLNSDIEELETSRTTLLQMLSAAETVLSEVKRDIVGRSVVSDVLETQGVEDELEGNVLVAEDLSLAHEENLLTPLYEEGDTLGASDHEDLPTEHRLGDLLSRGRGSDLDDQSEDSARNEAAGEVTKDSDTLQSEAKGFVEENRVAGELHTEDLYEGVISIRPIPTSAEVLGDSSFDSEPLDDESLVDDFDDKSFPVDVEAAATVCFDDQVLETEVHGSDETSVAGDPSWGIDEEKTEVFAALSTGETDPQDVDDETDEPLKYRETIAHSSHANGSHEPEEAVEESLQLDLLEKLFERLREGRSQEVQVASQTVDVAVKDSLDLKDQTTSEPALGVDLISETRHETSVQSDTSVPDYSEMLNRREEALSEPSLQMSRRVKRLLQDDQNELLDVLRKSGVDGLLKRLNELLTKFHSHSMEIYEYLERSRSEGLRLFVDQGVEVELDVAELMQVAEDVCSLIAELSLKRVMAIYSSIESGEGQDQVALINSIYRDLRVQKVDEIVGDYVNSAFNLGIRNVPGLSSLNWVTFDLGGNCSDCDDNTLANPNPKDEDFPTGHKVPPVHPGCRCLIVPTIA